MTLSDVSSLAGWLLEQIAETEEGCQSVINGFKGGLPIEPATVGFAASLLAECEAKRRIVERCAEIEAVTWWEYDDAPNLAADTLELLALPYADRPGYREEWRP